MISSVRYKVITDLINNSQDRGNDIVTHLNNMLDTLSISEILESSTDRQRLESQIDATLTIVEERHQSYNSFVRDFVFILQKYIDDNYSSVNDFLFDNGIQVLPVFAEISNLVGYPIDSVNIENIS
jgi:hypothetical protein